MKIIEKEKNRPYILALDFDNTIVYNDFPEAGILKEGAKEIINKLYDEGFYIIIWTSRYIPEHIKIASDFLKINGVKFHVFNDNYPELDYKPWPKIYYDLLR